MPLERLRPKVEDVFCAAFFQKSGRFLTLDFQPNAGDSRHDVCRYHSRNAQQGQPGPQPMPPSTGSSMRAISPAASPPGKACAVRWKAGVRLCICASSRIRRTRRQRRRRNIATSWRRPRPSHEVALKRRLLGHPDRDAVAAITGAHALRLWETDITTFTPAIEEDLQAEAKLYSRYTALMASAKIRNRRPDGESLRPGAVPAEPEPRRAAPRRGRALGVFREKRRRLR